MRRIRLMIAMAMVTGLSLVFAGSAFAAKASCGDCHGTHNGSAKTFESTTSWHNLRAGFTPAIWEDGKTPVDPDTCNNDGRGLHGIHMNYSSVSYGKKGGTSGVVRGNCDYCHKGKKHQDGYVNMSGSSVALVAGRQTSTAAGLSYNFGSKTCTNACHANAASTAPWGNYTSASIALSCTSCHGDVSNNTGLTGAHAAHLASPVQVNGGLMGAAGNAGCLNCHPDNRNDRYSAGRTDDGTTKAYPHASDGTNVAPDNASIIAGINATKAGLNTTCAASCHPRSATVTWGGASNCDMCHYYAASPSSATNTGTGALGGSHNAHFDQGATCDDCHGTLPTDTAHASSLPVVSTNATVDAALGFNAGSLTCSSTGANCHGVGMTTPQWGTTGLGCATCHEYPGVTGRDWDMVAKTNGHTVRSDNVTLGAGNSSYLKHMKATGFNQLTDTYAGVTADIASCGRCHGAATHRSGSVEVSDTHTLGLCSGTSYTFNPTTPGSNVTCSNVSCHNGRTTPNWW